MQRRTCRNFVLRFRLHHKAYSFHAHACAEYRRWLTLIPNKNLPNSAPACHARYIETISMRYAIIIRYEYYKKSIDVNQSRPGRFHARLAQRGGPCGRRFLDRHPGRYHKRFASPQIRGIASLELPQLDVANLVDLD